MNFNEDLSRIKGHLKVHRVFKDGRKECIFDDHNIIVSGMGLTLSEALVANADTPLSNFSVTKFQLGVGASGTNTESSSLTALYNPLEDEYGPKGNFEIGDQIVSTGKKTNQYFGKVRESQVRRNGETSVTYSLVVDETMANDVTRDGNRVPINEIGLFVEDPLNKEASVMVAYRQFTDVVKTPDFSVTFTWTISILDDIEVDLFTEHVFDLDTQLTEPLGTILFMNWLGIGTTDEVSGLPGGGKDEVFETSSAGAANGYGAWRLNTYNSSVYPSIVAYDCGVIPPATPYLDPAVDPSAFQYTVVSGELNSAGNLPKIIPTHPSSCEDYWRYMDGSATYITRDVWSFLRPHNGIYSSSMRDKESVDRFALATKILAASPGKNYGFDAFCPVIATTYYSDRNTNIGPSKKRNIPNIRHHAFENQLKYCEDNGLNNCLFPHFEFVNFWDSSDSELPTADEKMAAIREEIVYYLGKTINSPAGYKINGRAVLRLFGASLPEGPFRVPATGETWDDVNAELNTFFDGIRKELGNDFYTIRTGGNALSLGAWDAIMRLPSSASYAEQITPSGPYQFTDSEAAYKYYVEDANLLDLSAKLESGNYPGRLGGVLVTPGFHDIGLQFGEGNRREIPRQPSTIEAGFSALNFFRSAIPQFRLVHALSWDDTIEGHCFWPTVSGEGPTVLGAYNIGPSGTWALDTFDEQYKAFKGETYDPSSTSPSALFLEYDNIRGCP